MALPLVLVLLLLGACSPGAEGPYLTMRGGGFVFNYRLAEATVGFVAEMRREPPEGARLEAAFEDPAGGAPIVLGQAAVPGRKSYSFTTRPLAGIRAGVPYRVTLRLVGQDGAEIERVERSFRSELDQSVLPDRPPTIGPGYARNPAARPRRAGTRPWRGPGKAGRTGRRRPAQDRQLRADPPAPKAPDED